MSYTKLTDFAAKDALLSGNPGKLLRGTEIGAEFDAIESAMAAAEAVNITAPIIAASTSKTTPVDADVLPILDSAAANILKKVTWANVKATLKTYFDTLYAEPGANSDITSLASPSIGSATATTQATSDNSTKVATTAWVSASVGAIFTAAGFAVSLTANGYIKFPSMLGGWIVQWATGSAVVNTNQTITLPLTFPTAVRAVLHSGKGAYSYSIAATSLVSSSTSNAVINCFDSQNGANTCTPTILAIGY